jgi:hypothetical protein
MQETDPRAVLEVCAALIAEAEQHPADEPLRRRAPAERAADAAQRCLDSLSPEHRGETDIGGALYARRANALRLMGHDRDADARAAFDAALATAPDRAGWWYDLGLLHKHRGRWQEAYDASARARSLGGDTRPVLFNLAIAATALGRGDEAAACFGALGIDARVNDAGMPVVDGLPRVQVRVPARGSGHASAGEAPDHGAVFEVVWVEPISPLHGVVASPTFRDAPVDFGDVVLWDAAPVAVTSIEGRPVPRFPLLEILRRGDERRLRFVGLQQAPGEIDRLESALPSGCRVFVQAERVEHVCVRCASGEALTKHEHTSPEEHRIVYGKIVAPSGVDLVSLRDAVERTARARGTWQLAVPELYEQLGDTQRAGQEHQAWRGIERVAMRKGIPT